MKKDVIYIDADDEIAAVVDKVAASKSKVIALVLPKRFTMLHSSVNMKILNKAAADNKKNLVLITSEKALMPIAAGVGMYVAKGLQSKPVIPALNVADSDLEEAVVSTDEPEIDPNKSIGELSGDSDDAITIDNTEDDAKDTAAAVAKKDKKLAVPNFESFRVKLFLIIGGVILFIVFMYFALVVMPKSTVTLTVEQQQVPLTIPITASPTSEDNIAEKSFKLETKTIDKAESKTGDATGKKDLGEKASGTVQLSIPCSAVSGTPPTIPSGTGVSTGGLTFITQKAASLTTPSFSGGCKFTGSADVVAQNAGGEYNISSGRTFTVAGYSSVTGTNSKGFGGGTSNVVIVVSQEDCDRLLNELNAASNSAEIKNQLFTEFEQAGLAASDDSYKVETVSSTCEPGVGQEATKVTAKATYRYTVSGVNANSLNQLITQEAVAKAGIGQTVTDTGISSATITTDSTSGSSVKMTVKTTAVTGVKQDEAAVKAAVAGKNARETSDTLKLIPGVQEVKVDFSPFWVNKNPKNQDHITVVFVASDGN
jgi:uncharacterized integral membrane protein